MRNLFKTILLSIVFIFSTTGCIKKTIDSIEITPSDGITCDSYGAKADFDVVSNCSWVVQNAPQWCVVTPQSGEASGKITIEVLANETSEDRSAEIVVTSGSVSVTIPVLQFKKLDSDYLDIGIDDSSNTFAYDTLSGKVSITYAGSNLPRIQEGTAFVLPDEHDYEIRVVDSYMVSGNTVTIQTSPGDMCNLFRNVSFTLSTKATRQTKSDDGRIICPPVSYGYLDDKGEYHELYNIHKGTKDGTQIETNLWKYDANYNNKVLWSGKWGEISWEKCSDHISLDATFEFDFGEKKKGKRKIGDLNRFTSKLTGSMELDRLLRYEVTKKHEIEEDVIVKEQIIKTGVFKFAPGGVPVVILVYTHLGGYAQFVAEGSIEAQFGCNMKGDLTAGVEWTKANGAKPILDASSKIDPYEAYIDANASTLAKVSFYPQLELGLYSKTGFQIDFRPYVKETIDVAARVSTGDNSYFAWQSEIDTGMDMSVTFKADFGFWDKELWTSGITNVIEDIPLYYAPSRISLLSPKDSTLLHSREDSVKVQFYAEAYSPIIDKYYPCPHAFVTFGATGGELDRRFAVADKDGKTEVVWRPFKLQTTKSGSPADSSFLTEKLTSTILDDKGLKISDASFVARYPKDNLEQKFRKALVEFYNQTGGNNWTNNTNWCTEKPLNEWYGVTSEKGLYTLSLSENNLTGDGRLENCPLLANIKVYGNKLTSLDLSGCDNLGEIYCRNNVMTSIDIDSCLNLSVLNCSTNKIASVDISSCKSLMELDCSTNQITSLSVPDSIPVQEINCSSNPLTQLDLSGSSSLVELVCTSTQLQTLDLAGCSSLETLNVYRNKLTSLNVTGCHSLKILKCYSNQLTSLDVSECKALITLEVYSNKLTALNVSGCSSLSSIDCKSNKITTLDFSTCPSLKSIECNNNQLASLNLSGCSSLTKLLCGENKLTSLDLSSCQSLVTLRCAKNQIGSLDIESTALDAVYCSQNQLSSLNIASEKVRTVNCGSNQLISLDIRGNNLTSLDCSGNQISVLNIQSKKIRSLDCRSNKITTLDVSELSELVTLRCSTNSITSLNPSVAKNLQTLECGKNQLTSLDLSGLSKLVDLSCSDNQLTSLNLDGCSSIEDLYCLNNQLTTLDVSSCGKLNLLSCANNLISSLVMAEHPKLRYLWCKKNKILSEIPEWFDKIGTFEYDQRYTNYRKDENGQLVYKDNGVGWWYPGEPGKGSHKRN